MHSYQKREISTLLIFIIIAGLIGSLFEQAISFVAIALIIYVAITLRNTFQLHDWLLHRKKKNIPVASGYWGEIFNEIHVMEKERQKNRIRLTNILSRFRDAAAALPDGAVILTRDYMIDWVNRPAQSQLGINMPDDLGQQITHLIRTPVFIDYLKKSDYSKSITIASPQRQENILNIQIIPFGSSQKLLLCKDISHITRLEEMRSNFIANVSHELRSPITVLSGYLETFIDIKHQDRAVMQKAFASMHEQTKRMERLVTDLLALTKLETAPANQNDENIDIGTMLVSLKESAELLSVSGDKKHMITLKSEDELEIHGCREELHSLFSNLINNAVRYTPAGGNIEITWEKNNGGAELSVKDSGPGIAPHHIPHLTERFYRVDADRSRETGGTGLGLAIVKHILDRHNGKLDITSTLGQGSTFTCSFPKERVIQQ